MRSTVTHAQRTPSTRWTHIRKGWIDMAAGIGEPRPMSLRPTTSTAISATFWALLLFHERLKHVGAETNAYLNTLWPAIFADKEPTA